MSEDENNGAKKQGDMLLVQSKVREYIREAEMMCSSDLVEQLNAQVITMLDRAVQRAKDNNRKTARACDV